MIFLLPSQATVLHAHAVLLGLTPGNTAFKDHQAYVASQGKAAYLAAAESLFSGVSNSALAATALTNLGLSSAFTQADAEAFLAANPGNRVAALVAAAEWLYTTADANVAAAKAAYVSAFESSYAYSVDAAHPAPQAWVGASGQSVNLTTAFDNLIGTSLNDTYSARTLNNANTLQDGDAIDGGAGNDALYVDFTAFSNAITPNLKNIETVVVRAQSTTGDSTNGNNMTNHTVQLDAQRSLATDVANKVTADFGVTRWESSNSRSDVIIEDVRIGNQQKTKDITIAFRESDPGNVDFGLYFDQHSLRNASSGNTNINIFLMDTAAAAATPTTPLLNHNFNTYTFFANDVQVVLGGGTTASGAALDNATNYAELKAAFELALKTALVGGVVTDLSSVVTVGTSGPVNMTTEAAKNPISAVVAANFLNLTGEVISLNATGASTITSQSSTGSVGGWTAAGPAPSTGAIVQTFNTGSVTTGELVTSKVVLDDVGRGSTGGDLVIGGMSVGETSTSRGVERFEITVEDSSKLQTINGTNNALREVTIVNGTTTNASSAYNTVVTNSGNLTVNGNVNGTNTVTTKGTGDDTILAGVNKSNGINSYTADHHGAFGFTDVRLIDASAMTGKLAFTAGITSDSIAKYVTTVDTQANPAGDVAGTGNVNFDVPGANFIYTGGANNDTMAVTIDGNVASSRSHLMAGRSDFTFDVSGGAGNDAITVTMVNAMNTGGAQNWYNNQDLNNNVAVNGGAGNDTIRTPGAGDMKIDAGAGADTLYTDNTGRQVANINVVDASVTTVTAPTAVMGQYVYNTVDQATAFGAAPAGAAYGSSARDVNDLRSDTVETYNFFNSKLTVTFKGIPQSASIVMAGTGYKTTDLEVNQAIKQAINSDATLSKLLVAQDGPAGSLLVTSLIDGTRSAPELSVTLTSLTAAEVAALSATDLAAAGAAYGIAAPTSTSVHAAITAAHTLFSTNGDYNTAMTNDAAANIVGAASTSSSDNLVSPGTDNDVVVLGTTVGADTASSSNETLVYGKAFGTDVVVNFAVAGNGVDHFDFVALGATGYSAATAGALKATTIALETDATNTAAEVAALYTDSATGTTNVYVAVDGHNVGKVYSIVDGAGVATGSVVATLEGTIDLSDTVWTTLGATNFVNSGSSTLATNAYMLLEGPTSAAAAVVVPPVPGATVLAVGTTAPVAATAAADAFSFNVADAKASAPNTQIAITGFAVAADSLVIDSVTALGAVTLNALNGVDGIAVQVNGITNETTINFGADANGDVITVTLTGVGDASLVNISVI